jgi:OOP family OmpA-OmpF porin
MIMKWRKSFSACMVSATIFSLPTLVSAAGAPYVSAQAGGAFLNDASAGIAENIEFETGFFGALAVGYDFGEKYSHSRLEAEASYRQNHIDKIKMFGNTNGADGKFLAASLLFNGYYVYENSTILKPFIMGGLGFAWGKMDNAETLGVVVVDDNDFQFAYQGGAGLSLNIHPAFAVDLGYKFFTTTKFQFEDEAGNDAEFSCQSHTAYLGLRYTFW